MGRIVTVSSPVELDEMEALLTGHLNTSWEMLRGIEGPTGLDALRQLKFDQIGLHPLSGDKLNIVEQINQTFTILATLRAARVLMRLHLDVRRLRLAVGAIGGTDITDEIETLAAEVFVDTSLHGNQRFNKDMARLDESTAAHRYLFFAVP